MKNNKVGHKLPKILHKNKMGFMCVYEFQSTIYESFGIYINNKNV